MVPVELPGYGPAILKHYLPTKKIDPRNRFGRSKALKSFFAAESLLRRGFQAAKPLGSWSTPAKGSFLLLATCSGMPLHKAILEVEGDERAQLLQTLAQTLRRLHRAGVAYRDLKPSNLLLHLPGTRLEDFVFVDHDRNRFLAQTVPQALALRDLAALHAGLPNAVRTSERMRALQIYCPQIRQAACWQSCAPTLIDEAARRHHRWVPPALFTGSPRSKA